MDINKINYVDYGNKNGDAIVLLHGWGQNIQMMDMLGKPFADKFRIIILDFPGFGESKEPNEAQSVGDYANVLNQLLNNLGVTKPILIGHSFGGRVAIKYASLYLTSKVVLLSSPFRPSMQKTNPKVKIYKSVKKVKWLKPLANLLKKIWGSSDYNNASEVMRNTLVKVVNEDLTSDAKKIKCPVLLIYGSSDEDVLLSEGKALEQIIPDAGLVIFENFGHYAYLENLNQTIIILHSFLN